jgi:hypothetical protein
MCIIVEFSERWKGISKNQGIESSLPNTTPQSQDGNLRGGSNMNLHFNEMQTKPLVTSRVGKVPVEVIVGHCWPPYQKVAGCLAKCPQI